MQQHVGAPDDEQHGAFSEGRGSARADTDTSSAARAATAPRRRNGGPDELSIAEKINAKLREIFPRQMLQGAPVGTLGENDAMGTLTPPPGPTAHPAPPSRFDAGRPAPPMGPSGRAILFGLFALVAAAWLLMRAPTKLAAGSLPRLAADGTPAGDAPAGRCGGAKGCLIVYVAPWCGPCKASLPGDRALADFVKDRGIETTFVVGMDAMPRCAEMARTIGREVLVDASGAWARKMSIRGVPHFLVTGPDGRVKKRQAGALLASPDVVARHLGL